MYIQQAVYRSTKTLTNNRLNL